MELQTYEQQICGLRDLSSRIEGVGISVRLPKVTIHLPPASSEV
ncbi:MAG: hypothetical protein QNJ35_16195 [Paracoccaceae bacterium]|nr:hypothetical protein [Paracoccaceae bacterium]